MSPRLLQTPRGSFRGSNNALRVPREVQGIAEVDETKIVAGAATNAPGVLKVVQGVHREAILNDPGDLPWGGPEIVGFPDSQCRCREPDDFEFENAKSTNARVFRVSHLPIYFQCVKVVN